jgi:hypothetical protein
MTILFVIAVMEKERWNHLIFYFSIPNLCARPDIDERSAWIGSSR